MLRPLTEHELLVFWVQLLVLVATARLFGVLVRQIGLPSVIGELTAGLVLGPTVFGRVWESGFEWFLPDDVANSSALLAVSWLGIGLLLIVTGFETDLGLIAKLGRAAGLVTAFSLLVPFVGGLLVGLAMPDSFLGEETERVTFALFVAAALSVSALAVIAKILSELGLMRRDFGQITVAVGMGNDVIGWLMLAVFAGLASSGSVSVGGVAKTVGGMVLFVVLAFTIGQRAVDAALREVRRGGPNVRGALTVTFLTALVFGVVTQYLGIEAVLGCFVAGVIIHRSRFLQHEVVEHLEGITLTFLAPVFFATAGLRLDLGLLDSGEALVWTGIVLVVAIVAKFVGSFIGAKAAGQSTRAAAALGAGLNARGALEIVIATVGLSLGVFNTTAYTVIVLVPMVTSIFASASLRLIVRGWRGSEEEQERLEREEALSRNVVVTANRILLPSKGGPASIAAASVAHYVWPTEAGATIYTLGEDEADVSPIENIFFDRPFDRKSGTKGDEAAQILAEAKLGYGAIVLGVGVDHPHGLLSPMVDEIIANATIPVIIVRRARNIDRPLPGAFTRALVPVTGSSSSQAAQEVAFSLSDDLGTEVVLTHVVNREPSVQRILLARRREDPMIARGRRLLDLAEDRGGEAGASVRTELREAISTADAMVRAVNEVDADLLVLGARARNVDGLPFLGQTVEDVLARCDATVVVVATPSFSGETE